MGVFTAVELAYLRTKPRRGLIATVTLIEPRLSYR